MGIATFPAGSSGISTASPQWVLLDSNTSTGAAATRTFSNISQSYNVLKIFASGYINTTGNNYGTYFTFNGDTGSNYNFHGQYIGTTPAHVALFSGGTIDATQYGDVLRNNNRHSFEVTIFNYTSTTAPKHFEVVCTGNQGSTGAPFSWLAKGTYRPSTAAAITSITYAGDSIQTNSSNNGYGLFLYGSVI
jgi:hypothetical protein